MIDVIRLSGLVALVTASFAHTLSLGSTIIVGVLAFATLVGIIYGAKWKSRWDQAQATIKLYAANAKGHEDRADLALAAKTDLAAENAREKEQLLRELAAEREEIGRLRGRPDESTVLAAITAQTAAILAALKQRP